MCYSHKVLILSPINRTTLPLPIEPAYLKRSRFDQSLSVNHITFTNDHGNCTSGYVGRVSLCHVSARLDNIGAQTTCYPTPTIHSQIARLSHRTGIHLPYFRDCFRLHLWYVVCSPGVDPPRLTNRHQGIAFGGYGVHIEDVSMAELHNALKVSAECTPGFVTGLESALLTLTPRQPGCFRSTVDLVNRHYLFSSGNSSVVH